MIIKRDDITDEETKEMLKTESHHNHEIVKDENGVIRWKQIPGVRKIMDQIGLNEIWILFGKMGHGRNSEILRELYRQIGTSLFAYWETFYWEANNPDADKYKQPKQ